MHSITGKSRNDIIILLRKLKERRQLEDSPENERIILK